MGSGCEGGFMEVCQCALAGLIRSVELGMRNGVGEGRRFCVGVGGGRREGILPSF